MAQQLRLNNTGGRPLRKLSPATLAKQANQLQDVEMLDNDKLMMVMVPDWQAGKMANRAKTMHTYNAVQKFEIDADGAIKREDGAQLVEVRSSLVFATPEYVAEKSKAAEKKRWQNLASAIGKGLNDKSGKGVSIDDVQCWMDGSRTDLLYLFKLYDGTSVRFCDAASKGATKFEDVPDAQQKTIRRHLAAAKKAAGLVSDPAAEQDINVRIAKISEKLQTHYSAEALAKFSGDYLAHLTEYANGLRLELKRLEQKRDKQVEKRLKDAAKGGEKGTASAKAKK